MYSEMIKIIRDNSFELTITLLIRNIQRIILVSIEEYSSEDLFYVFNTKNY